MSGQQWSRISAGAAVAVVGALWLAGIRAALDRGAMTEGAVLNSAFVLSFGAGALFGVAGGVLWVRLPRQITGPLLVLSGAAISTFLLAQWRAIDGPATWGQIAALSIVLLRPLLVHVVLAYPVGRIRPRERAVVVPLYTVSVGLVLASVLTSPAPPSGHGGALSIVEAGRLSELLRSAQYTLFNPAVMAVVAAVLVWRLRRLPARGRLVVGPVYAALAVVAVYDAAGSWVFTTWGGDLKFDDDGLTMIGSADLLVDWGRFWLVPLSLLVSAARFSTRGEARTLEIRPADPDAAIRAALDDTSAQLAVESDDGWVGLDGRAIHTRPAGSMSMVDDELVMVVRATDRLEHPEVTAAALANASLIATNAVLLDQQRRRLDQVRRARAEIVREADAARMLLERDLHDGVQQNVLAAAIELAALDDGDGSHTDRAEILSAARVALDTARRDLARITNGLAPSSLQDGLRVALEQMAERSPMTLRLRYDVDRPVPDGVSNTAYFVIAEALTNVLKHAAAQEIRIEVADERAYLRVEVADDGRGMEDGSTGTGTRNMRDRVQALDGTFSVASDAGSGTTVRAEIPWARGEQ